MSLRWLLKDQLKFINNYYKVIVVSSSGDDLTFVKENQGVDTIAVEMTRKITPLKDLIAIAKLYKILRKEKPFIVHTHTPKAGLIGMLASFIAGVPNKLHTVAGLPLMESNGIKRKVLIAVEKLIYIVADRVYPNSYGLKDFILQNKLCSEKKIKVIANGSSNGIDTEHFKITDKLTAKAFKLKKELNINENDFVFCFIGRIVKDKGINELLFTFTELCKKNKNIKLLLVGPFEENLDPISDNSKMIINKNSSVLHVGYQEDVRPFLIASYVFVFPSYREGFPNVVMQAGAMGVPCIVTNINGCNEIIKEGINGIIVEPKNVQELATAMLKLSSNAKLRKTLAGNSRKIIVERYEQKYIWNEILKEYKSFENQPTLI